jgi:hypothetical protein
VLCTVTVPASWLEIANSVSEINTMSLAFRAPVFSSATILNDLLSLL